MYVDGFVLPIPKDKVKAYKKMATVAAKVWKDHGALQYAECQADDLKVDEKWSLPFPKLVKPKPNEVIFFSFIVYKNKAHRNAVNKKVMADPRLKCDPKDMPFDCRKMAYGGFKALVSA
ncbi:MAG: DUF1428 domain-containing protein [Candidatus Altimarinota bacterium]